MKREKTYKVVVHFVESGIMSGRFHIGDKIPSVNAFKIKYGISRSSIFQAMAELESRGLIEAEPAVGYFIASESVEISENILFLCDEVNEFKEVVWKSFMTEIGKGSNVDLMFHNYNRTVFETLLKNANGKYTSFVLFTVRFPGIEPLLKSLSGHIVLADNIESGLLGKYSSVRQDFSRDTYNALLYGLDRIRKYKRIILIQNSIKEPQERYDGLCRFSEENGFAHKMVSKIDDCTIQRGDLYITPEDLELVKILKLADKVNLVPGEDFGIISFNDTPIKEILHGGISCISTDFIAMGKALAHLVKNKEILTEENPCKLMIRKSI